MRGSHPGSFENAHALRDGTLRIEHAETIDDPYDLIVVGGGISGLSAAHFYRVAAAEARILIIENHDDFGGHAKRNEVHVDGHLLLLNGGTMLIDSPRPVQRGRHRPASQLGYRTGRTVQGAFGVAADHQRRPARSGVLRLAKPMAAIIWRSCPSSGKASPEEFGNALRDAPLNDRAKRDIVRIETGEDRLSCPSLTTAQTMDRLSRVSYAAFLTDIAKVDPQVIGYYQKATHGEFGSGIDDEPALDCWGIGLPGFAGMKLDHKITTPHGQYRGGLQQYRRVGDVPFPRRQRDGRARTGSRPGPERCAGRARSRIWSAPSSTMRKLDHAGPTGRHSPQQRRVARPTARPQGSTSLMSRPAR